MARTREFDEAEALDAAMHVFWERGFEATSLPHLLEAMGLSKSSFYATFESKEALFRRCIDEYANGLVGSLERMLAEAPSGMAFVRGVLEGVCADARTKKSRKGCLVMNTANEFGQRQPSLAKLVAHHSARFESVFEQAIVRAQREGEWQSKQPRRAVARYLLTTLSGLKTLAKAGASQDSIRETAQVALLALR